jgi:hypothetical protein
MRIRGELLQLGIRVSATTIATVLRRSGLGPAPQTRPHVESVPPPAGRRDARVRLPDRGDHHAEDAVRAGMDRARDQESASGWSDTQPPLGLGRPAGSEPGHGPSRGRTVPEVPDPRPRHQVHRPVRRGVPVRRQEGHPHPDPGPERQRVLRTVGGDGPDRMSGLDPHPRQTTPRASPSDLRPALQRGEAASRAWAPDAHRAPTGDGGT